MRREVAKTNGDAEAMKDSGCGCSKQHNEVMYTVSVSKEVFKSNFRQHGQTKSRCGKSRRREKKKDQRRERDRRKKMQVREQVEKSGSTYFSND